MTAFTHSPAAVHVRGFDRLALIRAGSGEHLRLLCSGDGWSLVGPHGRVLFQALGMSGRRECLEFARRLGALTVFS